MPNGKEETEPYSMRELEYNQRINQLCYKWFQLVYVCLERGKPADELVGLSRGIYFLKTLSGLLSVLGLCPQINREFLVFWSPRRYIWRTQRAHTNTHSWLAHVADISYSGLFHLQGGMNLSKKEHVNNSSSFDCRWMRERPEHVFEVFQKM